MKTNKEIVQDLYNAFKIGDGKTITQLFAPNIVWEQMEGFPNGGKFEGVENVFQKVFALFPQYWEGWGAVAEEFYETEDKVFVIGYYQGKSIETGKRMKSPIVHLYTLKDGRITHFRQFTDTHVIQQALNHKA